MKSQKGFTLIEILLAMTILAFITMMVTQGMRRGADFKVKNQRNIDQRALLNNAMRIIERDINMAFHFQDITKEVLQEVKKTEQQTPTPPAGQPNPNPNPPAGGAPPANPPKPKYEFVIRDIPNYTAFVGEKQFLHFTNLNGMPTAGEQLAGDQQEVGYYLKNCRSLTDSSISTQCLWRRTSAYVDEKVEEGGEDTVILEGVKRFELRYFGKQKEDWVEKWRTDEQGDDLTKNNFPEAVEVTVTIEKEKRELSAIRVIALRFPNNPEKKQTATPGAPGTPAAGQGGGVGQ